MPAYPIKLDDEYEAALQALVLESGFDAIGLLTSAVISSLQARVEAAKSVEAQSILSAFDSLPDTATKAEIKEAALKSAVTETL